MQSIRLYLKSMRMLIKSQLEYPASFVMQTLAQLVMEGGEFLAVLLIVDRFGHLHQWTPGNLYFFFGMMSVSFYITELFGRGITGNFANLVRTGQLDSLFLRPRGILTQVLCSAVDPRRITCIAVGVLALVMGSRMSQISWTVLKGLALLNAVICSIALILGLFMIEAVFCIYSVKSIELVNALTYGGRSACQYPVDIFPKPLRFLFTAVAPFALTLHVPGSYILGNPIFALPDWAAFVSPLAGPCVFLVVYLFFRQALRHYRSTGS